MLDAARDAKMTRVVNASSLSVYGNSEYLPYDEASPHDTDLGLEARRGTLRVYVQ